MYNALKWTTGVLAATTPPSRRGSAEDENQGGYGEAEEHHADRQHRLVLFDGGITFGRGRALSGTGRA